jgi:hypothetical protein
VNADKISASFEDGVLEVALPKSAKVKPRRLTVSAKKKATSKKKTTRSTKKRAAKAAK